MILFQTFWNSGMICHEQCMEWWLSDAAWLRALELPLDSLEPVSRSRDVAWELVASSRDHWEELVAVSSPLTSLVPNEGSTSTVLAAADWALRAVYCFQWKYSRSRALLVMATPKPENAASSTANTASSLVCKWENWTNEQLVRRNECLVIITTFNSTAKDTKNHPYATSDPNVDYMYWLMKS